VSYHLAFLNILLLTELVFYPCHWKPCSTIFVPEWSSS
jgi:hypothetical protein